MPEMKDDAQRWAELMDYAELQAQQIIRLIDSPIGKQEKVANIKSCVNQLIGTMEEIGYD
jgi:hypothetical protein